MATHSLEEIKKRLYGYECAGGENSEIWKNPDTPIYTFPLPPRTSPREASLALYSEWSYWRRTFTREDAIKGDWVKIANGGTSRIVVCLEDGKLRERELFDETPTHWYGAWAIEDGLLHFLINGYSLYILHAVNRIHSGVEFAPENDNEPFAYFKVFHIV